MIKIKITFTDGQVVELKALRSSYEREWFFVYVSDDDKKAETYQFPRDNILFVHEIEYMD